ncbi:MAG: hypothetical protein H7A24_16975 [Leptospiraceae bacterium]|nr:hypothetical protein [Leptospiraceae bacterium]
MTIEYQDGKLNRRKPRASGSLLKGKNCFLPESFERKELCMTIEHHRMESCPSTTLRDRN